MNKNIFLMGYILAAFISLNGQVFASTNVWGLSNIHRINNKSSAPYIVYMGSYKNNRNAQKMQSALQIKGYCAKIKRKKNLYLVYLAPFNTYQSLHRFATNMHEQLKIMPVNNPKLSQNNAPFLAHRSKHHNKKQIDEVPLSTQPGFKDHLVSKCKDCQLESNHWFIQLQGGVVFPLRKSPILVYNGSDFPAPENVDVYSVKQSNKQGSIALTVGDRIATSFSLIDHYTLSGRLQYLFPMNVGNTIMQYSLPEFLNYSYHWKLSALTLTADTKLNLFNFSKFSPYANGGLGMSFNQARSFNETAFSSVTTRISPAYANNTSTQFTYHVGAGLDFLCTPSWLLSAGYEFESFGNFSSGNGKSTWSGDSLQLGTYQTNTVLLGVTYLIGN